MAKLVTIFGGSGFVGRYIARRMAKEGWRVRVAVRNPNEAMFVRTYGVVGQVEPVFCNIRDDASVRAVSQGADAVVPSVSPGSPPHKGSPAWCKFRQSVPMRSRTANMPAQRPLAKQVFCSICPRP